MLWDRDIFPPDYSSISVPIYTVDQMQDEVIEDARRRVLRLDWQKEDLFNAPQVAFDNTYWTTYRATGYLRYFSDITPLRKFNLFTNEELEGEQIPKIRRIPVGPRYSLALLQSLTPPDATYHRDLLFLGTAELMIQDNGRRPMDTAVRLLHGDNFDLESVRWRLQRRVLNLEQ